MMIHIKQRIGQARVDSFTKGIEFCRNLYGGIQSLLTITLVHVCPECGWAPKFDFDYWILSGKGIQAGWYCAECGAKYCKTQMNGAFGIFFKGSRRNESFLSRIRMPNGKLCNLFTFLKFLNCIRSCNISIARGTLHLIAELIKDFK